jgi:outer membrane protein OmpA-like peptidoglycan-associated protein
LRKIVAGGGPQALGQATGGNADSADSVAAEISALEFDGAFIKSDLSELRKIVLQALGQGFPGNTVLVIGCAGGSKAEELELAAARTLAVKDLLLGLGVPARNVAADAPSTYLRPNRGSRRGG